MKVSTRTTVLLIDWARFISLFPARWVNVPQRQEDRGRRRKAQQQWLAVIEVKPLGVWVTADNNHVNTYQMNRSRLEQSGQSWGLIAGGVEAPVLQCLRLLPTGRFYPQSVSCFFYWPGITAIESPHFTTFNWIFRTNFSFPVQVIPSSDRLIWSVDFNLWSFFNVWLTIHSTLIKPLDTKWC